MGEGSRRTIKIETGTKRKQMFLLTTTLRMFLRRKRRKFQPSYSPQVSSSGSQLDPQHRAKISQVMDITGKTEDEVGTALFDCGWDETKAIELLIEEGGLGSWEETGK